MSDTFLVEVTALRSLSLDDAVSACVARGAGAIATTRVLSRARWGDEPFVECTLAITPAHEDVVWAPRPCAELVTRLIADRDDRRHEPALLAHHPDLWENELVLAWDEAVLAYAFLEHAPERSTLVITLPEHLAPQLAVHERWGSVAWAEVCDTECAAFPPPDGLAAMRRVRAIELLEGAESFVEINSIALSPDSARLAAVDNRGEITVYRVADGARHAAFGAAAWHSSQAAFTPDGLALVQDTSDGRRTRVTFWPLEPGVERRDVATAQHLFQLAFAPDGHVIAEAVDRALVLDAEIFATIAAFEPVVDDPELRSIGGVEISPTGSRGVVAGELEAGAVIHGFTLDPPAVDWRVGPAGDVVLALAFSPDGRELVVARHGRVDVLDAQTGAPLRPFIDEPGGSTYALAFSRDGRYLAAGHRGGVGIWRYADATLVRLEFVDEQRPEVFSLALSHDGRFFVAASARRAVLFEVADE